MAPCSPWTISRGVLRVAAEVRVLGDQRSVSELEVASSRIFFAASLCLLLVPTPSPRQLDLSHQKESKLSHYYFPT